MNLKDPEQPVFTDRFIAAVMVCVAISVLVGLVILYA